MGNGSRIFFGLKSIQYKFQTTLALKIRGSNKTNSMLLTRVLELDEQRQQSHEPEKGHCCREKETTREKISKGKGRQKGICNVSKSFKRKYEWSISAVNDDVWLYCHLGQPIWLTSFSVSPLPPKRNNPKVMKYFSYWAGCYIKHLTIWRYKKILAWWILFKRSEDMLHQRG